MIFAHFRESQAAARKARKIRAFETPKGTSRRAGSLENTVKHVVFSPNRVATGVNMIKTRCFELKTRCLELSVLQDWAKNDAGPP